MTDPQMRALIERVEKATGPDLARRLSPARRETLVMVVDKGGWGCDPRYKPAQALVEMGLLTKREMRFGSWWLEATPLGLEVRSALRARLTTKDATDAG